MVEQSTEIEQARRRAKLSVNELARRSSVSRWTIYKLEAGGDCLPALRTAVLAALWAAEREGRLGPLGPQYVNKGRS